MPAGFGTTWWGRAWLDALEQRAEPDPNRLPRGRAYAREGRVTRLEVEPGRVTALVRGRRATLPYRVTVEVPTLDGAAWAAVAAAAAAEARRAAALLDGELDPGLVEAAAAAGVALIPDAAELRTWCSCPDKAAACKHAAAVCFQLAAAIDAEPFVLLTLRGRARERLMADVDDAKAVATGTDVGRPDGSLAAGGRQVAAALGGGPVVDPGVVARDAWAQRPSQPPGRIDLGPAPGVPAPTAAEPPHGAPFTAAGLRSLAVDAANRAWRQLAVGEPSRLDLGVETDLARRAADLLDRPGDLADMARRLETPASTLTQQAVAWRTAGSAGLEVMDEPRWRPPATVLQRGLTAFAEAGEDPAEVQIRSNRLTVGDVQLRVTEDGRWWRYERRGRSWELAEPPAQRPEDLVST